MEPGWVGGFSDLIGTTNSLVAYCWAVWEEKLVGKSTGVF